MNLQLPFSRTQFLEVFAAYNDALWPWSLALWVATIAALVPLARHRRGHRIVSALLAVHWAWSAVVYHLVYFTRINPAAWLFAALFLFQAVALARVGILQRRLSFSLEWSSRHAVGAMLIVYSLVYPLLVLATGHTYPRSPTFGVPCPTTLLTAGVLLLTAAPAPRWIAIVPIVWCAIGGSAAFSLGVHPDVMLLVAGAVLLLHTVGALTRSRARLWTPPA